MEEAQTPAATTLTGQIELEIVIEGKKSFWCAHGWLQHSGCGVDLPVVIFIYVLYARSSATEAKLPDWVNINGYATTSHAIFPLPLLLGQKVRVKTDTSLWTSKSNIQQFSESAQSFLEKMFKALERQGNVTINSIDASQTSFWPYRAESRFKSHEWMMAKMCDYLDNLTAIHVNGSNNDCDEFASKTLAGAWCDNADSNCKPNASTITLNRTWSSFVDGVCPLKGADGSTRQYSGLKPVACFSKAEVRENERSGKDKGGTGSDDSTNLCD